MQNEPSGGRGRGGNYRHTFREATTVQIRQETLQFFTSGQSTGKPIKGNS